MQSIILNNMQNYNVPEIIVWQFYWGLLSLLVRSWYMLLRTSHTSLDQLTAVIDVSK